VLTVDRASAARLTIRITHAGQGIAENDWNLWIYPATKPEVRTHARAVRRFERIDDGLIEHLERGGDALVGLPASRVANYTERPVQLGFSSIFWNTLWTQRQAPTTLGILCDPSHPALLDFPTEGHSNWQWWYLLHRAGALRLDLLPAGTEPIVRIIDDWFTARPLGLIVELLVGRGRLILCGFAVEGAEAQDLVSHQLVESLETYMQGDRFRPQVRISAEQLRRFEIP
jgi:hypothetical protein